VNTDVQNGTLTLNTDGTFEYVPDRVEGPVSDSFIYQLNDADGGFVTATVSLSIANPVFENLPPIAEDDFFILLGQDSFQGNVLLNDKDPDGGTLSTKLVEQARFGSVVLNFDGSFSYALNGDAVGTSDSFVYQLFDADGASVKATVFIQIDNDVTEVVVEPDILLGSFLDDKLTAPNKDNPASIDGLEGDDTLTGSNQADTINAGDGSDRVIGLDGDDLIFAGSSEKDLRDVVFAGEGNDTVEGGHGNDELRGDGGDDSLSGGFGVDTVIGGNGNDTLTGSAFSDLLFGGADDDFINGGFGFDRVNGGAGADQFFHIGDKGHGSDWIQDYSASEGDVMVFGGGTATVDDFLVQRAETKAAGVEGVEEAFITHKPSGVLLWALVDGGAQTSLLVKSGGQTFDLLAPRVVIDVISKDILTSNTEETDLFF
jgi:Ca2+-binding RTX toxin-like protein